MIDCTLLIESGEARPSDVAAVLQACAAPFSSVAGLRRHIDNIVIDNDHRQALPPTGLHLVAVSQLGFDDLTALHSFMVSSVRAEAAARLSDCGGRVLPLLVLQNEVLPRPSDATAAGLIKRIGILHKAEEHSESAFRRWWLDVHGPVAAALPELQGYVQNLVYDTLGDAPPAADGAPMACDGFTELWFRDAAAMERAFPLRVGTSVTRHASRFIARISTLIVQEVRRR